RLLTPHSHSVNTFRAWSAYEFVVRECAAADADILELVSGSHSHLPHRLFGFGHSGVSRVSGPATNSRASHHSDRRYGLHTRRHSGRHECFPTLWNHGVRIDIWSWSVLRARFYCRLLTSIR